MQVYTSEIKVRPLGAQENVAPYQMVLGLK